jgi:crossover junction endodeoxyribonuclease RuvC
MKGNILGGDPGAGGALALMFPVASPTGTPMVEVIDTPTHEIRGKRRLDLYQLSKIVRAWDTLYGISHAIIENVGAMPGQAPNAMFSFGFSAGALQMAVAAAGIPMTLVVPQVWKKVYGIQGGRENKDQARQKASQLFPGSAHLWARKKDDGRAEAVLLAHYGRN